MLQKTLPQSPSIPQSDQENRRFEETLIPSIKPIIKAQHRIMTARPQNTQNKGQTLKFVDADFSFKKKKKKGQIFYIYREFGLQL